LHGFFHRKPYLGAAPQSFSIGMSGWWAFNFSTISLTLMGRRPKDDGCPDRRRGGFVRHSFDLHNHSLEYAYVAGSEALQGGGDRNHIRQQLLPSLPIRPGGGAT
jgi:hypothetical protein